jgi:hypothetical protein
MFVCNNKNIRGIVPGASHGVNDFSVPKVSIYSFQIPKYPQNFNYVNTQFYKKFRLVNKFNLFRNYPLSTLGAGSRRFESARPDQRFQLVTFHGLHGPFV